VAEPTVQVPVSLIERIVGTNSRRTLDKSYAIRELRALLSQPTPTPTAEPPRIEDLAPGSTFRADTTHGTQGELFFAAADGWFYNIMGIITNPRDIDPSTIRNVTPPATKEAP
jgi:hypothetical protein